MNQRVRLAERMDDPDLDRRSHVDALRGLSRINCISRTVAALWPPIAALARHLQRPLRTLDIATGSGDVPVGLAEWAARENVALEVAGCDISRRAIAVARARAARAGLRAHLFTADVLNERLPAGYDVVISTLFLHHLARYQAVDLLGRMRKAADHLVLVDDLRRNVPGFWSAVIGTRLLSRSPVVHLDGPRSVRAAFTPQEMARLAREAGMHNAIVTPHWPWRQRLQWERGGSDESG